MSTSPRDDRTHAERFNDVASITAALRAAAREALWRHKRLGESVVVWEDGRVRWIPPEEIPGPESEFWAEADREVNEARPLGRS